MRIGIPLTLLMIGTALSLADAHGDAKPADRTAAAQAFLDAQVKGDFAGSMKNFDDAMKKASPADKMEEVDDEYASVYVLDGDSWTLSTNFDKQRENQKPGVDVYKRVKAAAAAPKPAK